jgi:NADH-quinone oxidoreductase subunit J
MVDPQVAFSGAFNTLAAIESNSKPVVDSAPLAPAIVVALCVVAGIATWLLLPGKREAAVRRIGGAILLAAGLIFGAILVRWTTALGGMSVYFWAFAAIAIFASVRVITHTKPVYSALYFVLTVFATAGLFVLMWAEFMAAALVLIYAGAILITYVFVIMLASEATTGTVGAAADQFVSEHDAVSRSPLLASFVGFAIAGLLVFLITDKGAQIPTPQDKPAGVELGSAQELGQNLIEENAINVQLAAVILTVAMVGAITLARRRVIVAPQDRSIETVVSPGTPVDDNPHSIPVYGTVNPRHKAYPET